MSNNIIPFSNYRGSPQLRWSLDELLVDSFCGGGGVSTGIERALGRSVDYAINHSPDAISMHQVNHPQTFHFNESVWNVEPRDVSKDRPVGLVWASPDCTHHSRAKGGKPVSKTIRGLAWYALKWAVQVKPRLIMLENVEELLTWGPLTKRGRPDKRKLGQTFNKFIARLERAGYVVEYRVLRCSDYGIPTSRRRFFLIARRDGAKIVWPNKTHGPAGSGLKAFIPASSIIDWSLPCPSIFTRKKPLVENTLKRISLGLERFVLNNPEPFILRGKEKAEHLKSAFIGRHKFMNAGQDITLPIPTITAGCGSKRPSGAAQSLALHTVDLRRIRIKPGIKTLEQNSQQVSAFLVKYYGSKKDGCKLSEPLDTVTSKERFGLVAVYGSLYEVVDIGMRMLQPHELYRAHGFPTDYIFTKDKSGRPLSKSKQVAMVGNSVPPAMAELLVKCNYHEEKNDSEHYVADEASLRA